MTTTSNQKYEITEISHEKYPFLHRIRALRDVSAEVSAGDLGGFVESESNLSFEPNDTAWIFDDAIACNDAYVDKGAVLRGEAVVCDNAYISMGAVLSGHARVEDNAYIRGAVLSASARASGFSMILNDKDTMGVPILSGHCAVYGKVSGDVRLTGSALVISGEEIRNDSQDLRQLYRDQAPGGGLQVLYPLCIGPGGSDLWHGTDERPVPNRPGCSIHHHGRIRHDCHVAHHTAGGTYYCH